MVGNLDKDQQKEKKREMIENFDENRQEEKNREMIEEIEKINNEFYGETRRLKNSLRNTRTLIIVLSVVMLFLGFVLLIAPLLLGDICELECFISAVFGIVDLLALLFLNPIKRIHNLTVDMSQIIVIINSYQNQRGLRLVQMNANSRESVGEAAKYINEAAKDCIRMIKDCFEEEDE
jgi:ABC-type multidrug transport system fused ATPase/permease subunit